MAAKQARGAKLYMRQGASGGAGSFDEIIGLGDVTDSLGTVQFIDTTDHSTPSGTTSQTPTHVEAGTLSAPLLFDAENAVHLSLETIKNAMNKKDFRFHIPGSGTPGKRKSFAGYIETVGGQYGVNDLVRSTLQIRADGTVTIEDDV